MVLRPVRRRGMGLVGATLLTGGAYKAGTNAAERSEQGAKQGQERAAAEQKQAASTAIAAQPPSTQRAAPPQTGAAPQAVTDETLEQLRKLGELKKEGLLTYDEFETQKKRLLG